MNPLKKQDNHLEQQIQWILQEKYPEINPADFNGASSGKRIVAAKKDIERLKSGEPVDHIIGFMDFLGCKILANKDALIPRVETEFWTEQAIDELSSYKVYKVLDMFAGSGAIGVAVLKHVKNSRVTFAESEKEAVAQIKKNCKLNKLSDKKYIIIQSDIFAKVSGKFDYILANPPYIPKTRAAKIQKSVINYEPHAALFGGEDGLLFIKKFFTQAKNHLNENGKIYMEFDSIQKNQINTLLKKLEYSTWDFHKDQYGKVRYVVVQ